MGSGKWLGGLGHVIMPAVGSAVLSWDCQRRGSTGVIAQGQREQNARNSRRQEEIEIMETSAGMRP